MIAKKAFSRFKAVAYIPSIRVSFFSSSSSSQLQSPPPPDENSRVAVWWDLVNCPVPEGFDPVRVPQAIEAAVRANGINGPVDITAVADVFQAEHSNFSLKTLSDAGVTISYYDLERRGFISNYALISHFLDWMEWNPPPAHLFLIAYPGLRLDTCIDTKKGYNFLVASVEGSAVEMMTGYATIAWRWNDLFKGENLIGNHFNEIPNPPSYPNLHPPLWIGPYLDAEHPTPFPFYGSLKNNPNVLLLEASDSDPEDSDLDPEDSDPEEIQKEEQLVSPPNHHRILDEWPVVVWWDFDTIPMANCVNRSRFLDSIERPVRASGMEGGIWIRCFGDAFQLSRPACRDLIHEIGIDITHVPNGAKQSTRECLLANLKLWTSKNPPPAHLLLITSDPNCASTLRELRASNYNTLVVGDEVPDVVCKEAGIVWSLNDLLKEGENDVGTRYFNQPPDASLYGHYDVQLEQV